MNLFANKTEQELDKEIKSKALRKELLKMIKLAVQRKLTQEDLDKLTKDYKKFYDETGWNKQSEERLKTITKLEAFVK
jgi:uncharacterized membrane protein